MRIEASTVAEYIAQLPDDRRTVIKKLRATIRKNLPKGFKECINYGMIGYVVPHSRYPPGYHCDPELPVPFMNLASQKNFMAGYIRTSTYWLGSKNSMQRGARESWTWGRVAFGSRSWMKSPTN